MIARQSKGVKVAIYGSFILNVLLFGLKIFAVVISGSLSAIASAIDSFLDLLSGSIVFITSCLMKKLRGCSLYSLCFYRVQLTLFLRVFFL